MKIIAISDTHGVFTDFESLPDADLLVIAGDILLRGDRAELKDVMSELVKVAKKWQSILLVPGNHDLILEQFKDMPVSRIGTMLNIKMPYNLIISYKGIISIRGLKVVTWSYVPNLPNWAYSSEPEEDRAFAEELNEKVAYADLVVSHGPPKGILDGMLEYGHVGGSFHEHLKFPYDIAIFGHIHEQYGDVLREGEDFPTITSDYRKYYNVSICNDRYEAVNEPTIIEI